jgi:polysaccharide deacetylase family protein (PEP-CTERM system associated)
MSRIRASEVANALTFDVEDYFHVSAFDSPEKRSQWNSLESRVCRNTERLLDILAGGPTRATFFVLGWVAEKYPALVRRIASAGHELASHGFAHRLVYRMTPDEFRADVRRAKAAIEAAAGVHVRGFRAPSFSITKQSLWAFDILAEEGHTYDSSVYPIYRDRYGLPGSPRFAYDVPTTTGHLVEIPLSTVSVAGLTLPVGGGGYFRLYPYAVTARAIEHLNAREGRPAIVYLHPWEIDPGQPRQAGSALSRFRHCVNLDRTEARLRRLLGDFRFGTLSSTIDLGTRGRFAAPAPRVLVPSGAAQGNRC